jgi:hypothetical protein
VKSINQTVSVRVFRLLIGAAFILSMGWSSPVRADDPISELYITNVTFVPASPAPGEPFRVDITVANDGPDDTESLVYRDVYVNRDPTGSVDAEGCVTLGSGDYFENTNIAQISAGTSDVRSVDVPAGLTGGIYQIWAFADATCVNNESNETNNAFGPITLIIGTQTTVLSLGPHDGWVLESGEFTNNGGTMNSAAGAISIGDDAANKQYRSILSFDTSLLPDDAVIFSATLKFKYASKLGTLPFNTHGNLLADVRRTQFGTSPALQLPDFKTAPNKARVLSFSSALQPGNWYVKSITSANFPYISLTSATQFRLRFTKDDNNDFGTDILRIYSGSAAVANRPKLIIGYYVP